MLLLTLSGAVLAGRPVYQTLTLQDLVHGSHVIAVVRGSASPPVPRRDDGSGCTPMLWSLDVIDIIVFQPWSWPETTESALVGEVVKGKTVSVTVNDTALTDCRIRKTLSNGASFAADVYQGIAGALREKPFIIFLQLAHDGLKLTTDGATESLGRRQAIAAMAAKSTGWKQWADQLVQVDAGLDKWVDAIIAQIGSAKLPREVVARRQRAVRDAHVRWLAERKARCDEALRSPQPPHNANRCLLDEAARPGADMYKLYATP